VDSVIFLEKPLAVSKSLVYFAKSFQRFSKSLNGRFGSLDNQDKLLEVPLKNLKLITTIKDINSSL